MRRIGMLVVLVMIGCGPKQPTERMPPPGGGGPGTEATPTGGGAYGGAAGTGSTATGPAGAQTDDQCKALLDHIVSFAPPDQQEQFQQQKDAAYQQWLPDCHQLTQAQFDCGTKAASMDDLNKCPR
jgi:hypothetical protein